MTTNHQMVFSALSTGDLLVESISQSMHDRIIVAERGLIKKDQMLDGLWLSSSPKSHYNFFKYLELSSLAPNQVQLSPLKRGKKGIWTEG